MNAAKNEKAVAYWLLSVAGLVFVMVIVGAITRLTESGLSMVEWRPLIGFLPPLTPEEWGRVFELYQQTPEFQKKNFWMELDEFKTIFFWEWFHRVLGRVIGLAYGLPLLYFWARRMIPSGYGLKLFGMLILGGLQGVMGWYMVQSGLVNEPAVSHYRLAAHLGLAFLIFGLLLWLSLSLVWKARKPDPVLFGHGWLVLGCVIITVFWGAYTAGLDAGLIYNDTFPMMGGYLMPPEITSAKPHLPVWINFFEDHVGVQFMHRWLAVFTVLMVIGLWAHAYRRGQRAHVMFALPVMAVLQMGLGIVTLLSGVHIVLAVLHQAGALFLIGLLVMNLRYLKP